MRPDAGLRLDDRYVLRSLVAVGGMGEVWVAHDEALARDVAAKVLREEFAGDDGFIGRFRTEARNAARLSHPNIAQLYDYGEQGGSAWIVMELVNGEPLSDLLSREPVMAPSRVLPVLAQTARALHAAHVAGVVHRDVKPGNILVSREGRVKITDFGISLASNQMSMTASGMVMGTAQYLAPEQALGRPAAPASDLYSLGVVAYEALVGRRPFTGPTAVDIAVAHVNKTVPPMPDSVPADIASLVMRLLSKDPEQRPRSAAVTARLFDELLGATPATGLPVTRRAVVAASPASPTSPASTAVPATGTSPTTATASASAPSPGPTAPPAGAGHGPVAGDGPGAVAAGTLRTAAGPPWSPTEDSRNLTRRALRDRAAAGRPSYPPATAGQPALRPRTTPKPPPRRRPGLAGVWDRWQPVVASPWVVLVLLVGIAVLGALFADRILGAPPATEVGAGPGTTSSATVGAPDQDARALPHGVR